MEIRQLRYFLDIARTEHLTLSAGNLFVTQSTLSHGIRQLEQELGVSLFDRVGRGLRLSQAGMAFRDHAARSIKELEAGRMALSELSGLQAGRLTVGVFPTFLNTLMPATVAAFTEAYPGVSVEVRDLRAGAIEEQVLSGELDFGIAFHPAAHEGIEAEHLFEERLMLVVASRHPLANRRSIELRQLASLPLALLPRNFATRRLIDDHLHAAGVKPLVKVEIESVEALIGVCRSSLLASIVPERAALQAPDLNALVLRSPDIVRQAGILWRRGSSRSAAAREFAALLRPPTPRAARKASRKTRTS
jgi:LysR family cyn operon transcriptional activator